MKIEELVNDNEKKIILKGKQKNIEFEDLKNHLEGISVPSPSKIIQFFILKKYTGEIKQGVFSGNSPVEIYLTLDFFITIFVISEKQKELLVSLPVEKIKL